MRCLVITWLFTKRLIKNPAFIFILVLMPLIVTMFNKADIKEENNIRVGIYHEDDQLSKTICENLKNEKGYIKFLVYDDKNEMIKSVENKKIECGYIFPSDFQNRLDSYKIKKCITCIESPSTILSSLSDEVVFADIIEEYGKNIAAVFAKENKITGNDTGEKDEDVIKAYERFNTPEKTFSINYKYIVSERETLTESGDRTIIYIIHGMVSILILISGLFGAVKWLKDEQKGLYASFDNKEKAIIGFISILVPAVITALSGIITIYLSNTFTSIQKESISMILYVLLVTGFSYLIKLIVKSGSDICALLPAVTLGSLIFCPVFIDASKFVPFISRINKVFPTFYYLNAISSGKSAFMLMLGMSFAIISAGFTINMIMER